MTYVVGIDIVGAFTAFTDAFATDESGLASSVETPSASPSYTSTKRSYFISGAVLNASLRCRPRWCQR
jgi:hypothetical protein